MSIKLLCREMFEVYTILQPPGRLPLLFDSPHSGRAYPPDFHPACPSYMLAAAEDNEVDQLFAFVPSLDATLLAAQFPRTYIDVNRAVNDLDPHLLAHDWPGARPTARAHAGIGLIRRLVRPDVPLYAGKLDAAAVRHRIAHYYEPYHAALKNLLDKAHYRFGHVWHINCHSMPAKLDPTQPDFVLGDRDGTSCGRDFTFILRDSLRDLGYRVALNKPYKGVEIVRRHGRPREGRNSVQLEINKALYWDEQHQQRKPQFGKLQDDLAAMTKTILNFIEQQSLPLAAD